LSIEKADMNKYFHRGAYILKSFEYPDLINASFTMNPGPLSREVERRIGNKQLVFSNKTNFTEHFKYRYILSADGRGAAWKRVPVILHSNSILFKPFS
jgi:hypothetical protein